MMQIEEMKTQINTLKLYMKHMEEFSSQAGTMIYEIEEKLMDFEDELFCQKYNSMDTINNLKVAATHHVSPPRLVMNHCSEDRISLADFLQYFSQINKLISKRS
jgi:hypothetical protein